MAEPVIWVLCDENGAVEDVIGPEGTRLIFCRAGSKAGDALVLVCDDRDGAYLPYYPEAGKKWNAKKRFEFGKF